MNGRSNAAVLLGEAVKGLDGFGVAQNNGNLPPLVPQGGLPFRAGLGGHRLLAGGEEVAELISGDFVAPEVTTGRDELANRAAVGDAQRTNTAERDGVAGQQVCFGEVGKGELHGVLRVGPIPTMGRDYMVTSDASTTVRREVGGQP